MNIKYVPNWLRYAIIAPIRAYKLLLSPVMPPACRFYPTCSDYAAEAILRHGVFYGSWLAIRRILRCNPLGGSGYDPVPPTQKAHSGARSARPHG